MSDPFIENHAYLINYDSLYGKLTKKVEAMNKSLLMPNSNKVAILFGPEQSGLSNNDLMLSDCIFTIPTSFKNKSLNLSHSVLLVSYNLQKYFDNFVNKNPISKHLSDKKSFNTFMNYLKFELNNSGFLHPKEKSDSMIRNIHSMFLRANLSKKEIQTLWGMIKVLKNPRKR